ncbi:hypothetical protein SAY87_026512 [Trapa incisa]|uniref:Pentatricopeptide repeat-containing protein n=1 Tax=Trapa incisa TaxID=236973 RepID=A0AAN7JMC5_9MYRT|nr:hypothetical protein SAY87_026512 [Trapa incisa]
MSLLDRLKEKHVQLYYKVVELMLSEETFQIEIRDYSKLIDTYAKENRCEDVERVFVVIQPSMESCTLLVQAYGKVGDPDQARSNFDYLIKCGH